MDIHRRTNANISGDLRVGNETRTDHVHVPYTRLLGKMLTRSFS